MTFLAWDVAVTRRSADEVSAVQTPVRTSLRVRVRLFVRALTSFIVDSIYHIPANRSLEKVSAFAFVSVVAGKLLFFALSPANVSIHALGATVGSGLVSATLHFYALRKDSMEMRTAATLAGFCSWVLLIVNFWVAYAPHLAVPHFDTTAARIAIEYAIPLSIVMACICALQILVLARDQVSVPIMTSEMAFAFFVIDCYERVLRIQPAMKIEIAKYVSSCYAEWKGRK